MTQPRPGISLCMIVKNEERFLGDALRSVAGIVDEICIVDTGSSDGTVALAQSFGARVKHVRWDDDFAAARNEALALATRRWIFVLDADERLDPGSGAALRDVGGSVAGFAGKWITCSNLCDDVAGSGAMSNALVRLFPNHPRIRYRNPIHEFVALDGAAGGLAAESTPIRIVHYGYLSAVVRERDKAARNLRLSRAAAERAPDDPFHQYNLGMALLLAGDRGAALAALERVRRLTRATPRGFRAHALCVLADLYAEERGDLAAALATIAECLAVAPAFSTAHFTHGKLLVRAGDGYAAREAFGRAIAAGAHDREQFVTDDEIAIWKAHNEIGATLVREERFAEALQWFELGTQGRPTAVPLALNRAKCHERLGDAGAAEALFGAAFAAGADQTAAIEWVNFLLRMGRNEDALRAIDASLERVEPGYRRVFLGTAALIRLRAGDAAAARATVERALAVGDREEARATVLAFAGTARAPELAGLLEPAGLRAPGLRIAYTSAR